MRQSVKSYFNRPGSLSPDSFGDQPFLKRQDLRRPLSRKILMMNRASIINEIFGFCLHIIGIEILALLTANVNSFFAELIKSQS